MKNRELDKIKQFPITTFLDSLGIAPADKRRAEYYYTSPLRPEEKTPSFCVNEHKNTWFDHGAGPDHKGGDIIDLVQQLLGADFKSAVEMLRQVSNNPQLIGLDEKPKPVVLKERNYKNTLELVSVADLSNHILWSYLEKKRGININLLKANAQTLSYLKEVKYNVQGRKAEYFAIGFKNSADAYELRSQGFQSFIGGKKTFTYIKGRIPGCAVFESFVDYFSALTHYKTSSLGYDIMILNSTRLVKQALPILKAQPNLHLFLDNDATGLKTAEYIQVECKEIPVKQYNHLYQGFKDINDFLTNTKPDKPLPGTTRDTCSEWSQKAKWWLWVVFNEPQETKKGQRLEKFTFYSYNNEESGFQQLLQLRQELEGKTKYFRICERTTGREFKILDKGHVS